MIDYAELCSAARDADESMDYMTLSQWLEGKGVEVRGLLRAAEQRAMRAAALLVGGAAATQFKTGGFQAVRLSERAMELMPVLTAVFVDGFAVGLGVKGDKK